MKNEVYMNIPELSVDEMTETLVPLYVGAICMGAPVSALPSVFLWGAAGVGKSQGVRQLAMKLETQTGKKVVVTDVRLLLFSPVDLRGVPVADANRTFTDWLRPRIFDMDASEGVINILFLDELSAAPQSVQAAAYQITQDHKIGEHSLPDNCIVIGAGNRTSDMGVAYKMPKPLANRMMHFTVRSDYESWKAWAITHHIDPRIIAYLSFDRSRLCASPDANDLAFSTPRSWEAVDNCLKAMGEKAQDIRQAHHLICACVGKDTAVELEAFSTVFNNLPNVDSIFKGSCREYPKQQDVLFALSSSLVAAVDSDKDDIGLNELDNVCAYASRFPADFSMAFFQDLNHIDGVKEKLARCDAFNAWLVSNKRYL